MSEEIRDLDVSEEEGEDIKGGTKGPMPPERPPGKPTLKSPGTATGVPGAAAPKPGPGKMPPGRLPPS